MSNIVINRKTNSKNEISLLLKTKQFEVMLQTISVNATTWIEPAEDSSTIEFFYILKGNLILTLADKKEILTPGDSFSIQDLKEKIHLSSEDEVALLYVTNSFMFDDISSFQDNVKKIRNIINYKDENLVSHLRRCHFYCFILYQLATNKQDYDYDSLILGSLGHDIGKSIMPSEILNKYPKLNKNEKKIYYRHILDSSKMIDQLFGSKVATIVSYHHEYLDGSGYFGISGDDISKETRMIVIANDFDHLVFDKKNKVQMNFLRAAKVLLGKSNKYDSEIVKLLIKAIEENQINENIQEELSKTSFND